MAIAPKSKVTVIGAGYVGLPLAAILAGCGYRVFLIEINNERLAAIKTGRSFFYETGLDPLIAAGLKSGHLTAADSYEQSIPISDIIFSCVGTPDNADGSSNLTYVYDAADSAARLMKPGAIYAQKSTVPAGSGAKIEKLFGKTGKKIRYVSNPEFLREGSAIADSLWPDRIVVGGRDKSSAKNILDLHRSIENYRDKIAEVAKVEPPASAPKTDYLLTNLASAELIKVSANAFLALKISFANSIAKLADQAGADINEVMNGIGTDRRIGPAFLNAGRGYGGGCFPKDVSGLMRSAEEHGVDMEIMSAGTKVNNSMPHYIINKAEIAIGSFDDKRVAVLGLAFKAGTSDTRRSPAIVIANTLAQKGAVVTAHDPEAMDEAKVDLRKNIKLVDSPAAAIKSADCVFIATDWPEFKSLTFAKNQLVVDAMNCLPAEAIKSLGKKYIGVGR